jgi:hypothetical protein
MTGKELALAKRGEWFLFYMLPHSYGPLIGRKKVQWRNRDLVEKIGGARFHKPRSSI